MPSAAMPMMSLLEQPFPMNLWMTTNQKRAHERFVLQTVATQSVAPP